MLGDFAKAVGQMGDPRFRRVVWLGVGLTIALLVSICAMFLSLIASIDPEALVLPFIGQVAWLKDLLGWGSILLVLVLSFFFMIPVASAFTGIFLDNVAEAVEGKFYPQLPPAPKISFLETMQDTLLFLGLLIGVNLFLLLMIPFITILYPLLFWLLNGFLLGREYFQIAAMRRLGRKGAKEMRKKHGGIIMRSGLFMALLLMVPVLNLLMPILGAAMFTHLFHRLSARG
jgi:uncharacterized protein involved in cysteine biosynthesis